MGTIPIYVRQMGILLGTFPVEVKGPLTLAVLVLINPDKFYLFLGESGQPQEADLESRTVRNPLANEFLYKHIETIKNRCLGAKHENT